MERVRGVRYDRALAPLCLLAAALVCGVVALLLWDLVQRGYGGLQPAFILGAPAESGRAGGINSILVATGLILVVGMLAALPVGVGAAIYLAEFANAANPSVRAMQRSLDILASVPSIVFGLVGNALFCRYLGLGFSILSGGLTLACMVLPLFIRTVEIGIRAVPTEMRHAAAALGMSKSTIVLWIVLPAAMGAVINGIVLSVGRAAAETAALVFTSGYVDRMPTALTDSGRSMSVHIYDLAMNVPGGDTNAAKTAMVLLVGLARVSGVTRRMAGMGSTKG